MATVKVKFRASSKPGKEGTLFFQVIHGRVTRQIATGYKIFEREWDAAGSEIILADNEPLRHDYLLSVKEALAAESSKLKGIIARLDKTGDNYSVEKIVELANAPKSDDGFIAFAQRLTGQLKQIGKKRTADTYTTVLNSFKRFRKEQDLPLDDVDSALVMEYETWLKENGICKNTVSFYMRNLRAIYNRAAADGLVRQTRPFARIYTGVARTAKRAITADDVRRLMALPLPPQSAAAFARDIFLFSFYTCGMSFVDIAHLKRSDIRGRYLCYRRQKTGQAIRVRWQPCMQQLVKKYRRPGSPYLFPIITGPEHDATRQCQNALHLVNRQLRILGELLALPVRLTSYVARHSWASIAKSSNVPLAAISEAMGHTSERTTRIYLAILVNTAADSANQRVLSAIMPEGKTKTAGRKKGMPR